MLACFAAKGAMVATFHTATARSRALQVFGTTLQPGLEKITGRIAVSPMARKVVVEHLGHDAVLVPNGVYVDHFDGAQPLPDLPAGPRIVFLGRIDEPRKEKLIPIEGLPPDLIDAPVGCPFVPRCTYKVDRCVEENPSLEPAEPGHTIACWVDVTGGKG